MSSQAMRRSGGVVPAWGQGWGASALVLGTGILLTQYLVLVQSVHEPREGRDMKCKETKGVFTSFSLRWQTLQLQSPL